ncbi:MAG: Mut7-C RNAse domain-containing protein [Candidatus Aminicenantes bacterium]|nr:Mut7-C RNAse domain-containing protein [Candidatus Aminicenantes bacterium]
MTFAVDCMLGKLAKWLKILGFDTVFHSRIEDDALMEQARREGRTLLTRDTGFFARAKDIPSLFIKSERWEDQVRQVLAAFNLTEQVFPFSRCIGCNAELAPLTKDDAANLVSAFVHRTAETFSICPQCGRVFWRGTHSQRMEKKLKEFLNKDRNGGG